MTTTTGLLIACGFLWAWACAASASRRRWMAETSRLAGRVAQAEYQAAFFRAHAERWHDQARKAREQAELRQQRHHHQAWREN